MARQRRRDTKPELIVRRLTHRLGFRFRTHNRDLPGSPDLANRKRAWVIFVHGCFWHQHPGCSRATIPKNNRDWWLAKFEANRARDRRKETELRALGFHVVVIWECETRDLGKLEERITEELTEYGGSGRS